MEVYRQSQIKNLQDAYHRKLHLVSEHYHKQVEQVRDAYASQVSKIKDYGQTQYDSYVANRVDNVREGYNAQLARLREFGSRHADQLFEGYERQLNRLRTFTLQQRMKLMRQYQLEQRDVNELLEKFPDADVHAAVNREDPLRFVNTDLDWPEPRSRIQKSVSVFSLPEFMLVDGQGEQMLRQVTPSRRLTSKFERPARTARPVSEADVEVDAVKPEFPTFKAVPVKSEMATEAESLALLKNDDYTGE